jgi:cytochrome b subunit of formate dehydrogenase
MKRSIQIWWIALLLAVFPVVCTGAMSNEECLICHEDPGLVNSAGKNLHVNPQGFSASVHNGLSCTDCHSQQANFEDTPHFKVYEKVACSNCHDQADKSFTSSFHGKALATGSPKAPDCSNCHGVKGSPHQIERLDLRSAENSCRRCHTGETGAYDGSVHSRAATAGKPSPGCTSCHPTHSAGLPPSVGAVNRLCESCHAGSMKQIETGIHRDAKMAMSCASCHDVHATHKPQIDKATVAACEQCHAGYRKEFIGTVHEPMFIEGKMSCLSCHRTHQVTDASETEKYSCGACHTQVEQDYRTSVHRLARLHGNKTAATCADCHDGHHVKHPTDPASLVSRERIPQTCGKCHSNQSVITADYVRLPISLPSYTESVHGTKTTNGLPAVCTDCHGVHSLQGANEPTSEINRQNLPATCGKCHEKASQEYVGSVHGRAVALGIKDSPSCTDCHDEHLILHIEDPKAATNTSNMAHATCGKCHQDPAMAARYGLPIEVIESYDDSYHGWAIRRGGKAVAVCVDCHTTHDVRSELDPASSIHKSNVVMTCAKCHPNSNIEFASSYSHLLARGKMMVHDWVRVIYLWLIALVLGGMFVHNLIIFIHAMRAHRKKHDEEPAYQRMTMDEVIQHIVLAVSFIGLGITGFALRFPDTWWAHGLAGMGMSEEIRRLIHRGLAVVLVLSSFYHVWFLLFTKRGKKLLVAIFPKFSDIGEVIGNMLYYFGLRKEPPRFGMYDYTQKAEYWALIWGTIVMGVTGVVLWFPAIATGWLPAWVVRVCETIHYYEAILAVSAIVIWHFFFVIVLPKEYPMSWTWITGRMSKHEWKETHPRAAEEMGEEPKEV